MLFDEEFIAQTRRRNVERVRADFLWEKTLAPLVEFVANPHRAADSAGSPSPPLGVGKAIRKPYGLAHDIRMFWHYLRAEGIAPTWQRFTRRLRG